MKKTVRMFLILLVLSMLVVPAVALADQGDPPGQLVQLQLLAFNDYHGHLEPTTPGMVAGVQAGGGTRAAGGGGVARDPPRAATAGESDPPAEGVRHCAGARRVAHEEGAAIAA